MLARQPSSSTHTAGRISSTPWRGSCRGPSLRPRVQTRDVGGIVNPQEEEYEYLTEEEVEDRMEYAAGLISVIDDLRPLDRTTFNGCYEIWKAIENVPEEVRWKLLDEIDPGGIYSMWKHSMGRYVLNDDRALELLEGYSVWDDLPRSPGEVYTYLGRCEKWSMNEVKTSLDVDVKLQDRFPRETPWLKPTPGSVSFPGHRFKQLFFMHPETNEYYSRVLFRAGSFLDSWWLPVYNRVDIGLTLTPVQADAGADITLTYPQTEAPWDLEKKHLPNPLWPSPMAASWSPFSRGPRDFLRPIGPGVYVGCGYRTLKPKEYIEDNFVYFMLVRKP